MESGLAKLCAWVETQTRDYGVAGLDANGGLLFEPRVLWDVGRLDVAHPQASLQLEPGMVQLSKEAFRNGTRWPVVITRLSLAAINYLLASNDNDVASDALNYRNATSVLDTAKFILSVPRRQFYSKRPVIVTAASMRPTAEPLPVAADQTVEPLASGIFGLSRLEFDKKLRLPRNAAIEVYLGSYTTPATVAPSPATLARVTVEERGGLVEGAVRYAEFNLNCINNTGVPVFPADAFGSGGQAGAATPFPSTQALHRDLFVKQKPSRGVTSADFGAINVHLNQIAYDAFIITNVAPTTPLTPLSLRVPTRVRTVGGGTGADWWTPGCPLALAFNEVSPALVYDLPMPITLNPGDTLDIQLLLPLQTAAGPISPVYQIGVAASGFAVIEG